MQAEDSEPLRKIYWDFLSKHGKVINPMDLAALLCKQKIITPNQLEFCRRAKTRNKRHSVLFDQILAPLGHPAARSVIHCLETLNFKDPETARVAMEELRKSNQEHWSLYTQAAESLKSLLETKIPGFRIHDDLDGKEESEVIQEDDGELSDKSTSEVKLQSEDKSKKIVQSTTSSEEESVQELESCQTLVMENRNYETLAIPQANQDSWEEFSSNEDQMSMSDTTEENLDDTHSRDTHSDFYDNDETTNLAGETNEQEQQGVLRKLQKQEEDEGGNTTVIMSDIKHNVSLGDVGTFLGDVDGIMKTASTLPIDAANENALSPAQWNDNTGANAAVNINIGNKYEGGAGGTPQTAGVIANAGVQIEIDNQKTVYGTESAELLSASAPSNPDTSESTEGTYNKSNSKLEAVSDDTEQGLDDQQTSDPISICPELQPDILTKDGQTNSGSPSEFSAAMSGISKIYPHQPSRWLVILNLIGCILAGLELIFGIAATSFVLRTASAMECAWIPNEIEGSGIWAGFVALTSSLVGVCALHSSERNTCLVRAYQILIIVSSSLNFFAIFSAFTYAGLLRSTGAASYDCQVQRPSVLTAAISIDILLGLCATCYSLCGVITSAFMCRWFQQCCPPTDRLLLEAVYQEIRKERQTHFKTSIQ